MTITHKKARKLLGKTGNKMSDYEILKLQTEIEHIVNLAINRAIDKKK